VTLYPDLSGKGVLITGGASGIGAAIAEAFAQQGCKVAVLDRDAAAGAMLAARHGVKVFSCDVTDIAALRATIAEATAQIGIIRVLINNVANDARHSLDAITPESFDDSIGVNLRPHIFAAQAVAPFMRGEGGGSIITLGSNAAAMGLAGYPLYVAAKAAIEGLTKALARELGVAGIRVNAVAPGWVKTDRQEKLWITPQAEADLMQSQSLKRWIMPADIAAGIVFLASDAASMITGQTLTIDAGRA
jgi:NAD(P)-dependent dehydrogenase (short-subunit alcohol dehydrogenase family)